MHSNLGPPIRLKTFPSSYEVSKSKNALDFQYKQPNEIYIDIILKILNIYK